MALINIGGKMPLLSTSRLFAVAFCAVASVTNVPAALAQSGPPAKPSDQQRPATDAAKDGQKRVDEIAEASRVLSGPAGNPECVWLGRRVVSLLWRDDLDTAFRHLDLYDRFGCPSAHIQATFRCLIRQGGNIDPKQQETLNGRVHACWLNPTMEPPPETTSDKAAPPAATGAAPAR